MHVSSSPQNLESALLSDPSFMAKYRSMAEQLLQTTTATAEEAAGTPPFRAVENDLSDASEVCVWGILTILLV